MYHYMRKKIFLVASKNASCPITLFDLDIESLDMPTYASFGTF